MPSSKGLGILMEDQLAWKITTVKHNALSPTSRSVSATPFLSLPFRAFSRLLSPTTLARKSHLKIPLFIPSIFPMRWLLAYVEGQDSRMVGKAVKTTGDKPGIAGRWRKVS